MHADYIAIILQKNKVYYVWVNIIKIYNARTSNISHLCQIKITLNAIFMNIEPKRIKLLPLDFSH